MGAFVNQVRPVWNVSGKAPGISTLYFDADVSVPMAAVRAFFDAIKAYFPSSLNISFPTAGMKIDTSTGQPVGGWTAAAQTNVVGTGGASYVAPAGAVVNWRTGAFTNGREIRGKTFLVPLVPNSFNSVGGIDSVADAAITSAANALANPVNGFQIWSRAGGGTATVTSAYCTDKAAVLRSRRD